MPSIRCLFCSKATSFHKINAQKKINGKIITVTNSPVYYCADCKETFLSKEAQGVFDYVRDRGLGEKGLLFNFEDLTKKVP